MDQKKAGNDEEKDLQLGNIIIEDFSRNIIMPGLIDTHVNLQAVSKEEWEGFEHGTAAAAAGGVTTLVDLPTMKNPALLNVKNLKKHLEVARSTIKVDVGFLAYLADRNIDTIQEFVDDGTVLGFCSFLSAPLNRKLEEMTEQGLSEAIQEITKINPSLLYYIEPLQSEGRHMYAKSPFRKQKMKSRLSQDIPKSLNLMAFAFPDGNEGDHSSCSEDEAVPQILNIEKLQNGNQQLLTPERKDPSSYPSVYSKHKFEEPDSAALRVKIKEMREDVQNLAMSELMMYETNASSNNLKTLNEENKEGTPKDQQDLLSPLSFHKRQFEAKAVNKIDTLLPNQSQIDSTKSLKVYSTNTNSLGDLIKFKKGCLRTVSNKVYKISKGAINFNAPSPRVSSSASKNSSINSRRQSLVTQPPIENLDIKNASNDDEPLLTIINPNSQLSNPPQVQVQSLEQHIRVKPPVVEISSRESLTNTERRSSPVVTPSLIPPQGRNSFVERRKQLMAQKMSANNNSQSDDAPTSPGGASLSVSSLKNNLGSPVPTTVKRGSCFEFKIQPLSAVSKDQAEQGFSSCSFGASLVPLNTNKREESDEVNNRMQSSYKFFLSLQPVSFEENGVSVVEKAIKLIPDFQTVGCRIHLINLSSNIGLDKVRQLKKSLNFQKVTYEITPHHLLFSSADIKDKETVMKCSPPIRDQREQGLLIIGFKKLYFDAVSSGHFPVDPMYKSAGGGNFFKAFNGVSTLGFSLQAMWTMLINNSELFSPDRERGADIETEAYLKLLIETMCERPAQLLGLQHSKGSLQVGKQADIVVFDPTCKHEITEGDIHNRHPQVCIYKGKTLAGRVTQTFLRGVLIYSAENPSIMKEITVGRVLKRTDFNN